MKFIAIRLKNVAIAWPASGRESPSDRKKSPTHRNPSQSDRNDAHRSRHRDDNRRGPRSMTMLNEGDPRLFHPNLCLTQPIDRSTIEARIVKDKSRFSPMLPLATLND